MQNEDIFKKPPMFSHNGESLDLKEIISKKEIFSITVNYLSKERKIKHPGLKGLFGFKKIVQDEKEITVNDPKGINLTWDEGNELVTIRFWNKEDFEKLSDGNYDESTIFKRYVMTIIQPYQFNFHIGNLQKIEWESKILTSPQI